MDSRTPTTTSDGERRCHWALLDTQLRFRYLDTQLTASLGEQSRDFLTTSLYDWLRPEELQKARDDFGLFLSSKTLFGTVNRTHMMRVHAIRKSLGAIDAEDGVDEVDQNFRQLKIISSYVGDNTVLCFFHHIADRDPETDNNETTLSAWSNWCGQLFDETEDSPLSTIEAAKINTVMAACEAAAQGESNNPVAVQTEPRYIFQIYASASAELLVEHPPLASYSKDSSDNGHIDFAKLAKEVWEKPADNTAGAKTSCTRRYKSTHPIIRNGATETIQSVIIRYQSVCFACFQTRDFLQEAPKPVPLGQPSLLGKRRRSQEDGKAVPPPLPLDPTVIGVPMRPWNFATEAGERFEDAVSPTVASGAAILGSFQNLHSFPDVHDFQSGAMINPATSAESLLSAISAEAYSRPLPLPVSPYLNYPTPPVVPRYAHPVNPYASHAPTILSASQQSSEPFREEPPTAAGPSKTSDTGPRACTSCGTTNSPEWRKGPNGVKSLCNACGLRFARSQARKTRQLAKEQAEREGRPPPVQPPKKKKAKTASVAPERAQSEELAQSSTSSRSHNQFHTPLHLPPIDAMIVPQYNNEGFDHSFNNSSYYWRNDAGASIDRA